MPIRPPVQARSRARYDAILDAADEVFLEMGYSNATTNHIAARAGTSIGSLYRFFPDKEAVLVALAARYGARMQEIAVEVTPPDPGGWTLASRISHGIDTFNRFLVSSPGLRTLIVEANHPALAAGRHAQESQMVGLIGASIAHIAPDLPDIEREALAEVTQAVLGTLQTLSVSRDEVFRALVVAEAKTLLTQYLAHRLKVAPDQPLP